ncbi:type II toxin-antitoxin system Phd/YefM family antitoxin [Deferrisoma palaeochoriense]
MRTVNIHEAKTHLSRLVREAARGKPFVIARAGKPLVKVVPYEGDETAPGRLGFMRGEIDVPEDFDEMGAEEIGALFGGEDER